MRFDVRKMAMLLLLAAPAVQAQLWSGPAAVEVRVQDQKGLPVAGAQIQLQYNALDPKAGPPAVATDGRGNATVGGLAEGSWLLEVSHQGFMTYMAEINVREGGRPTVILATQVNVPGALRTMRVELSRGRAARASAPPVRPAEAARPKPAAPAPPRSEVQPAPASRPLPTPPAEPALSAAPSTPPAPAPQVQPAPEPRAPKPPQQEPAVPKTPAATPAAPAPAVEPPRPMPVPPAPAPPADPVRLRTAKDRTCFECPPGESALSTERVIPPGGGPGCGVDMATRLRGGQVPADLAPGCHVLRIALPAGARYTGYRYEIQDERESLDCLSGRDCPRSTGRWPSDPVLIRGAQETVVLAPFESGPAERERRAVLTVYFTTEIVKRRR